MTGCEPGAYVDASVRLMAETQDDIVDALVRRTEAHIGTYVQGMLLAASIGQHIAVRASVRERAISPGMALARALLENAVTLTYMSRYPGDERRLAVRWYLEELRGHKRRLQHAVRIHGEDLADRLRSVDDEIARTRQEAADELGMTRFKKLPSIPDMAASFSSKGVTKHGSDILSQYVHSGLDAVGLHLELATDPRVTGSFSPLEKSPVRIVRCASLANAAMFDVAVAVSILQDWPKASALDAAAKHCERAFAELTGRAEQCETDEDRGQDET